MSEFNRAAMDSTTLLLIDMQERLVPHIHDSVLVVARARRMCEFFGLFGLPVVKVEHMKLGKTIALDQGTDALRAVGKKSFSCLAEEKIRQALPETTRTLALIGVETHICVLQTALHGLEEYQVQVVCDAVGSRYAYDKEIALSRMGRAGVSLTTVETLMFELLGRADTKDFKKALPLIKG